MTWPEFYRITRFAFDVKMELEHVAILTTIEIPDEYAAQIDEISYFTSLSFIFAYF